MSGLPKLRLLLIVFALSIFCLLLIGVLFGLLDIVVMIVDPRVLLNLAKSSKIFLVAGFRPEILSLHVAIRFNFDFLVCIDELFRHGRCSGSWYFICQALNDGY